MTLTPIKRRQEVRDFKVFDLEWTTDDEPIWREGYFVREPNVRMCGVYDGQRYVCYRTIEQFLEKELVHSNRGKWYYAHAGGLADMLFILWKVVDRQEFTVKASFSGSSAIIVHITRGNNVWHFIDSYWLLRDKLANIAKWIGMKKGDVDFNTENWEELRTYNELDCVILWKAINSFETSLLDLGGQLQMTLASCAMQLFRRKFLHRTIQTSNMLNEVSRFSYFGSRVEVFQKECHDANYYDINSSFPYAMTFPSPGNMLPSRRTIPDTGLYLANVTIQVPEMYFPPIPVRANGSVYFPVGKWRCWLTNADVELLHECGGRLLKSHEVIRFDEFTDLAEYSNILYERRRSADNDMEKVVYKLLLNSLYGKFAESSIKSSMLIRPDYTTCPHFPRHPRKADNPRESICMDQLLPGVWLIDSEVPVAHAHYPISAHITAMARRFLYRHMARAEPFYYCDTDGFATSKTDLRQFDGGEITPKSDKLGDLKLERTIREGYFIAPKVYRLDDKVKAKGFSLMDKRLLKSRYESSEWLDASPDDREKLQDGWLKEMAYDRWCRLQRGEEIEISRMARIRELYRMGLRRPIERTIKKRLQRVAQTKRKFLINGDSRPWVLKDAGKEVKLV